MSVLVLLDIEAAPGKEAELVSAFAEVLPDTRAYDGCESLTAHRNLDRPGQLLLVERWGSRNQHETYLQWRGERGDLDRLGALMAGPPDVRYCEDVDI
jgi:quinol monooxygenase YgiN